MIYQIDGLKYKIGLHGKVFYLNIFNEWKLSSRRPNQLKPTKKESYHGSKN